MAAGSTPVRREGHAAATRHDVRRHGQSYFTNHPSPPPSSCFSTWTSTRQTVRDHTRFAPTSRAASPLSPLSNVFCGPLDLARMRLKKSQPQPPSPHSTVERQPAGRWGKCGVRLLPSLPPFEPTAAR
ncbi:hypothetical protein LY76DRAFT_596314 [Colletotrichum caudatum]|nr:hypothetical protein LY76DRAFT_596314 [Colletotrichum caudatum]